MPTRSRPIKLVLSDCTCFSSKSNIYFKEEESTKLNIMIFGNSLKNQEMRSRLSEAILHVDELKHIYICIYLIYMGHIKKWEYNVGYVS